MKKLHTSASSITTYLRCRRQWWLQKVAKCPTKEHPATRRGTVLHEALERFYLADDNGMLNGKPVDLFPKEWEKKDGVAISPEEQILIKKLIEMAIQEGVAIRRPDRNVEGEIRFPITDDLDMLGFIDVEMPGRIEDHKTRGRRSYIYSQNKMRNDTQLRIYAYSHFMRFDVDAVTVCHNNYVTDPDDLYVKQVEVKFYREDIEQWFQDEIVPIAEQMYDDTRTVESHRDIPFPEDPSACRAYGGCPFVCMTGCGGTTNTPEEYKLRFDQARQTEYHMLTLGKSNNPNEKEHTMPGFSLKGRNPSPTPKAEPAVQKPIAPKAEPAVQKPIAPKITPPLMKPPVPKVEAPEPTPEPTPEPVVEAPVKREEAPWYVEGCTACDDNTVLGLNSKSEPCAICVSQSDVKPHPRKPVSVVGDKVSYMTYSPEPKPSEPVATAATDAEVKVADTKVDDTPAPEPKKKPRKTRAKATKYTLVLGLSVTGDKVTMLEEKLHEAYTVMCSDAGVDHYTKLDTWQRRDKLAEWADKVLKGTLSGMVAAPSFGHNPDMDCVVAALLKDAEYVVK